MSGKHLGKHRGVVTENDDPRMLGRIKARVPEVTGKDETGWALPCAPFGGHAAGFFALPPLESGVWVEFEHGNPDRPIWIGSWWGSQAEMPSALLIPKTQAKKVLIRSKGGHSVLLDDSEGIGGITMETSDGAKIAIGATGIEISNGLASISMVGSKVSINGNALEVL